MPLHEYTKQIYEGVKDAAYVVRFIDYLISKYYKRTTFMVNDVVVEPLITGVLENVATKEQYKSLADFYNKVTGENAKDNNVSLLAKINVTKEYSIMRIICKIHEECIVDFVDQRYRSFLMYRDIIKRIKNKTGFDVKGNEPINLWWNGDDYELRHTNIFASSESAKAYELLEAYENRTVKDLYYCDGSNKRYLITDS